MCSGITLTNNEVKDINVTRCLKNRGIWIKETTGKNSQEARLINFLGPLMKCISGMNLSPANKNLFHILFIFNIATDYF